MAKAFLAEADRFAIEHHPRASAANGRLKRTIQELTGVPLAMDLVPKWANGEAMTKLEEAITEAEISFAEVAVERVLSKSTQRRKGG